MLSDHKIKTIEAWKLVEAYKLTKQTFNLLLHEVGHALPCAWIEVVIGQSLGIVYSTDATENEKMEKKVEFLYQKKELAKLRILDALLDASLTISQKVIAAKLHSFVNLLFDEAESCCNDVFRTFFDGVSHFTHALYNRKSYAEVQDKLGAEYILVGYDTAMEMEAYIFYDKLFRETIYLNKGQAVRLLGLWGYSLQKEMPGLNHFLVNKLLDALDFDIFENDNSLDYSASKTNIVIDMPALSAWEAAIFEMEAAGLPHGYTRLPGAIRAYIAKHYRGVQPARLRKENDNLYKDLKDSCNKYIPYVMERYPTSLNIRLSSDK